MSTANKLTYLNGTKQAIKQAINEDFEVIDNNTTFREYADEISSNNAKYKDLIPKETKNATNTLDISNSSGLDKALVTLYGNTYQEGEPTPDAPKEIQVVSGDNTIKVTGKNLLQLPNGSKTTNGVTATITNGKLKIAGTTTKNWFTICNLNIPLESGTYTFSYANKKVNRYNFNIKYADNTTQVIYGNVNSKTPITLNQNATITAMFSDSNAIGATFDYEDYLMLEKGSSATEYEPHQSASYPISLGNIELCKIGNYKDRIYPLNGKWYLNKQIGKVVLDGSESWTYDSTSNYFRNNNYNFENQIPATGSTGLLQYSDYFKLLTPWNVFRDNTYTNGFYWVQNSGYKLAFRNTNYTNATDFKNWLSTNNVAVYYPLKTPTTTEITENNYPTLYNQLNNIKLFEGVNHITMTNESGLDVEFDITYYKDWKLD